MAPVMLNANRRGFTLLELLLASAVIASIALLGTAMWSQSAGASEAAQRRDRGLRLQRIGTLVREQWSQRRLLKPIATEGANEEKDAADLGVVFSADGVEFVTAAPILYRDMPLVVARYEWADPNGQGLHLRYIERPVLEYGTLEQPDDARDEPLTDLNSRRIVLLEGCEAIAVERFGATVAEEVNDAEDEQKTEKPAWHGFGSEKELESDALRLSVRWRGEEAVWVFVARPSR